MIKKNFTPLEANQRLPLVKKIVSDIQRKAENFRALMVNIKSGQVAADALVLEAEVEGLMGELDELGCFYKDWDFKIGLVDFPSTIDGKPVLLCWRSDEEKVIWYHDLESGFNGRKLIPEKYLI